jgi:diguanylate cyclase (GGDEF)-like protein
MLAAAAGALLLLLVVMVAQRIRAANQRLQRSNAELKAAGERDPLTGLANRRALYQTLARVTRERPLEGTLFMIDIDGFKGINDHHGHAVGDAVLIELAQRLRDALRGPDLIVRWGGEEFLVVMPTQGPEQAEALARRLLYSVGDTPVAVEGLAVPVTVSVGFLTLPLEPHGLNLDSKVAIDLVDAAMLLAKQQGRNRAYGVRLVQAHDEAGVAAAAAVLDAAVRDGMVQLTLLRGPGQPASDRADADPMAPRALGGAASA